MHRLTTILVCVFLTGCGSQEPTPEVDHVDWKTDYSAKVAPILLEHCADCHSGAEPESGVVLASLDDILSQRLIAPGDSEGSLLVHVVSGPEPIMPPENSLSETDVSTIRDWIQTVPTSAISKPPEAATHWAWKPLSRPDLPSASADWCRNAIDQFVASKLSSEGLQPSPEADRETLARRLSLAITGLPPQLNLLDGYLTRSEPEATNWLIDRLLGSQHYGEHWGRYWLDVARYADSHGYHRDQERPMWMFRDWVINAFNTNMKFDEFTICQLAGDLLPRDRRENKIASGFHRNTMFNQEGGAADIEFRAKAVADRVETTATVWLGATMQCARCHNHPNEPFTQVEYFQLFAFFNNTTDQGSSRRSPPIPLYISGSQEEERKLGGMWAEIRRRGEILSKEKRIFDDDPELPPMLREYMQNLLSVRSSLIMAEREEPRETFVHRRGDPTRPGPRVLPAVPALFADWPAELPRNRLGLAKWLVSPANSTTPRVTVNRIWQRLFGTGLVRTSEDFGTQGEEPSHPELLDWLAAEFVDSGWDVKALIRLIVDSATFRQSSVLTDQLLEQDPENRQLARGPRFRLDAEVVRDTILVASGLLDRTVGGRSVYPPQPEGLWDDIEITDGETMMKWRESTDGNRFRRGLYTFWRRSMPYPMLTVFDAPSREGCVVRRDRTNTPLQALVGMNDPTFSAAAIALGKRMQNESNGSLKSGIELGYRLCAARTPSNLEVQVLSELWNGEATRSQPSVIDDGPVEGSRSDQERAWRIVAGVLLNMHATLTQW